MQVSWVATIPLPHGLQRFRCTTLSPCPHEVQASSGNAKGVSCLPSLSKAKGTMYDGGDPATWASENCNTCSTASRYRAQFSRT